MPELPEVETIKRQLADKVVGLTIENILINKPKLFIGNPKTVTGLKVQAVRRRAKMIVIELEKDWNLLIHLKMSGQLIYDGVPNKFTHIVFELTNGSKLYFNDMRQFGWIKILNGQNLKKELERFGPEPLSKEFTLKKFQENLFAHKHLKIKSTLMDQTVVAGIGNIYASEACFIARIDPRRRMETLSKPETKALFGAIKKVLTLAIKYQGTSADSYVTLEGKKGAYYRRRLVYDRRGEKCPDDCGGKIEKITLSGRGTYFCPICQE